MAKFLKNPYAIAFFILSIVLVLAFQNIVFGGKTLMTSGLPSGTTVNGPYKANLNKPLLPIVDGASSAWHFEPAMQLNNQAYQSGHLPLWNPYNGAGQPLAADMQSSSFNPLALPLMIKPTPTMWDFFMLLRLLLAGLFTFMFLRLIKLNQIASLTGAAAFMLSGYLVFFVNMAQLNVEILIPLMLFATEYLVQRRNLFSTVILAVVSAFVIIGGMPESAILNFGFAFAYFVYRIYVERKEDQKTQISKLAGLYLVALVSGAIISAVSWAPFVEYSKLFFSTHNTADKGLVSLPLKNIIQYLAPLFLGVQNTAYVGIIPLFLILVCKKEHKYKWFFIIAAAIIGLKIFGLGVNWLGALPLINKVFIYKYGQAILAMAMAVLLAIVVHSGLKAKLMRVVVISTVWSALLLYFYKAFPKLFAANIKTLRLDYYTPIHFRWALVFLALAVGIAIAARWGQSPSSARQTWRFGWGLSPLEYISIAVLVLITAELWLHIPIGRTQRRDPYIAPPFVKYIQAQKVPFRTYATDSVLWPNTNAPYKIQDVRSLNAMQPTRYMTYLALFSDLRKLAHVTGLEGVNLDSQFFDALNVRYVLAVKPLQNNLDYWLEVQKVNKTLISEEVWFNAPFEAYFKFPLDVKYLNFSAKVNKNTPLIVNSVINSQSKILLNKDLTPNQQNYRLNVAHLAGRYVKMQFNGKAYLNAFHYSNGANLNSKFKLVYTDHNVKPAVNIYKNTKMMPRIMAYDKIRKIKGSRVEQIKGLNIRKVALVEKPLKFNTSSKVLKYSAKVTSYKPLNVKIKVRTNKEALLVLGDTYYPGWKVYVDGKEQEIIPVNYMFRGVKIAASTRQVVFSYESGVYKTSFRFLGAGMLAMVAMSLSSLTFGVRSRKFTN